MTPLGYIALIQHFDLRVPPLQQTYVLAPKTGVVRHRVDADGTEHIEIPRNRYAGQDSVLDHLAFALRREQLNLTVLAALFEHDEALTVIRDWLKEAPSSSYARLAVHLAKWLSGATALCEFMLTCIAQCVEDDLVHEVSYLQAYDQTKARLEAWLDLPQPKLDLLIRLIVQGQVELSQRKHKLFAELSEEAITRAEAVVNDEFDNYMDALDK